MMKSATNSVKCGPYVFQPTKYDDNGDLYCMIVKRNKCKLTGLYHFDTNEFEIIWTSEGFINHSHKKMLDFFLKEYDWS